MLRLLESQRFSDPVPPQPFPDPGDHALLARFVGRTGNSLGTRASIQMPLLVGDVVDEQVREACLALVPVHQAVNVRPKLLAREQDHGSACRQGTVSFSI